MIKFTDKEDLMRWYYNTHTPPPPQGGSSFLGDYIPPNPSNYPSSMTYPTITEYVDERGLIPDISKLPAGVIPDADPGPFYGIDDPTYLEEVGGFDMKTAEGYESYLASLPSAPEPPPSTITYDAYTGAPIVRDADGVGDGSSFGLIDSAYIG